MSDLPPTPRRLLALDTGSPVVSVAVAIDGEVRAQSSVEQARSSVELLQLIDRSLAQCGLGPGDLDALVVLRGPGSFTGLRVGLATALGFVAGLGIDVAVLPSLAVLAAFAAERSTHATGRACSIVSAIDALRGEWFAQTFAPPAPGAAPRPLGEAEIVPAGALASRAPATLVGFGVERLAVQADLGALRVLEAGPLAAVAARLAPLLPDAWDRSLLTEPLYLREPAVTLPAG